MEFPATKRDLFALLDAQRIEHRTFDHAPVFRVEDGAQIKAALPGGHTKNLFLKDARNALWLVSALGQTRVDLKRLPSVIGSGRLSFGSPALLHEALGVQPGSVTVFALVNDGARRVRLVLDRALFDCDLVNFHPLSNDATTAVSHDGLLRFLSSLGIEPLIVDFAQLGETRLPDCGAPGLKPS